MLGLPFNKWTLQFHEELHTQQYHALKNEVCKWIIKVQSILFSLALFVCLCTFIVQKQHFSQILFAAFGIIWCLLILVLMKKTLYYLQHYLIINYALTFAIAIIQQFFGEQITHFSIGFICGQVLIFCLFFIDFKVKIILLLTTTFVLLAVENMYKLQYYYVITFQIVSLIVTLMLVYVFEFTSRAAFVLNIITNKQQEIINLFVNDGLIGISFNVQSRQFNLEFKNKTAECLYNISDNDTLRLFIRSSIVLNQSSTNKNLDENRRRPIGKRNLEDFLFARTSDKLTNDNPTWEIEINQTNNKEEKKLKIEIQTTDYGKPILTLIIKSYEVPKLISKYESTIKKLQKILVNQSQNYAIQSQKISLEIKQQSQLFGVNLQILQSLNNQIMNTIKNYITYFSPLKIDFSRENIKMCKFNDFIGQIEQFFTAISQKYSKKIYIQNQLHEEFIIRTNLNLLCQLISNIFEGILILSKDFNKLNSEFFSQHYSDIQLSIHQSFDLQKNNNNFTQIKRDFFFGDDVLNHEYINSKEQDILQFCFSFISDFEIFDILNFDSSQVKKVQHSPEYFAISNKVSKYLISLLGPYNEIFTICEKFDDSFSIQINFYIYKNQSKVQQSFTMQQHCEDLFQGDLDF